MDAPSQLVTLYANREHSVYFENHKKPTLTINKVGSTGAMFVMLGLVLPAFLPAIYERDGLPPEKVAGASLLCPQPHGEPSQIVPCDFHTKSPFYVKLL